MRLPSCMADFVPLDRLLQKAYFKNELKRALLRHCILGLHPCDETAMLVYKTIENGPTSFA